MKLNYLLMAGVLLSSMVAFLSGLFAVCVLAGDAVRCGVYGGVVVPKRLEIYGNGSFYTSDLWKSFRCNCNQSGV
ncbi:MAG: hypothetical protein ACO2PN_06785 [Pyrobaculum sp.]